MGVYMTLYPSGVSWQSILTFDGPSMVTDNVPGPARVVLMKNSDWIPGIKKEEVSVPRMVYRDEAVRFGNYP